MQYECSVHKCLSSFLQEKVNLERLFSPHVLNICSTKNLKPGSYVRGDVNSNKKTALPYWMGVAVLCEEPFLRFLVRMCRAGCWGGFDGARNDEKSRKYDPKTFNASIFSPGSLSLACHCSITYNYTMYHHKKRLWIKQSHAQSLHNSFQPLVKGTRGGDFTFRGYLLKFAKTA